MNPTKKVVRKSASKTPQRKPLRVAQRKKAKPIAPKPWTDDIRGLNVVWFNVSDWERAKRFYGETLGLPVAYAQEEMGWIEYGRELPHLGINRWGGPGPLPAVTGGGIATLTCADVRAFIAKLVAKGVRCDKIEEMPGMVILGMFYDPDGNRLQVAQSMR
jgi:predicted enzyme related to lactoylglutathione lyase